MDAGALEKIHLKVEVELRHAEQIEANDEIDGLTAVRDIGRATLTRERNGRVDMLLVERFLSAVSEAKHKWPYLDL